MALRFPQGLYLSSISSSASYKQLAQLCCQWKLVNNGMKTTFKAVPLFYQREWNQEKGLHLFFHPTSTPIALVPSGYLH